MSNHVVERTDRLPAELIVKSEGTDIFSQELPRVCHFFSLLIPCRADRRRKFKEEFQ